jgi:hypothetical protein
MSEDNKNDDIDYKKNYAYQIKVNKNKLEKIQEKSDKNLINRRFQLKRKQIEANDILKKFTFDPPSPSPSKKVKNKKNNNKIIFPKIIPQKPKPKYRVKLKKVEKKNSSESPELNPNDLLLNKSIDQLTFEDYLKIQSRAESRFRVSYGDESTELLDFIKKINEVRQVLMEKEIDKIMNIDDRYNDEIPEEDTKINLEDKGLLTHKWKNIFSLQEYQNFFLDELKGKISNINYREMLKKFKQISKICFSSGHVNYAAIKRILGQEY